MHNSFIITSVLIYRCDSNLEVYSRRFKSKIILIFRMPLTGNSKLLNICQGIYILVCFDSWKTQQIGQRIEIDYMVAFLRDSLLIKSLSTPSPLYLLKDINFVCQRTRPISAKGYEQKSLYGNIEGLFCAYRTCNN